MISPEEFKNEVSMWSDKVGVKPKEIHIRKMKKKWASCSGRGRLTFAISLLEEPKEMQLKVILHELLHLRHPDHGKMFRALLNSHYNNYFEDEKFD
ncbi:unnamed protein product [marine sediment metagenome]|uniref:YgjP-like metallopeptidase domain-containing protein n=1 Tax=marine sediment metagenome TaxID=412755 RepID=X0Z790_9ZZZZ